MSDWSPISASHTVENLSFQSNFLFDKLLSQKLGRQSAGTFVPVPPPNIRKSIASFEDSQISPICPHKSPRVEEDVQYSGRRIKKEKTRILGEKHEKVVVSLCPPQSSQGLF